MGSIGSIGSIGCLYHNNPIILILPILPISPILLIFPHLFSDMPLSEAVGGGGRGCRTASVAGMRRADALSPD